MREVKFRAYLPTLQLKRIRYIDFETKEIYALGISKHKSKKFNFDEVKLMQYTGFKDRDGIEIYEGDIVKDENENERLREVIWCLSDGAFYFSLIKQNNKPLIGIYRRELGCYEKGKKGLKGIRVVGNIYENNEALKEI